MAEDRIHDLSIQWHLTTRCGNRCRHCYMYDERTYEAEKRNELDLAGLRRVLDSIAAFEEKWQAEVATFAVSGGDPLLHPDALAFARELKGRGKHLAMMGNPETLTAANLAALADLELRDFQLSLDGLEKTHDYFRGEGSFQRAVQAIGKLKDAGIRVQIMFTVYPENHHELLPLLRFVAAQTAADRFTFDLGTCAGQAAALERTLDRTQVKTLFAAYLAEKERLADEGYAIRLSEKNKLLQLLRFEQGTFFPFSSDQFVVAGGCYVGWTCVPILSDGTVLACRRFPLKVGKMPEQSFEQIFLGSDVLKRFRRPQFYAQCGTCDFYQHCRGCPALVHGLTGDPFAPHPLCFRQSLTRKPPDGTRAPEPIPFDTSLHEEHDLVAGHFANRFSSRMTDLLEQAPVQRALSWLSHRREERSCFIAHPDQYLAERGLILSELQKLFVAQFITRYPPQSPAHAALYRRLALQSWAG